MPTGDTFVSEARPSESRSPAPVQARAVHSRQNASSPRAASTLSHTPNATAVRGRFTAIQPLKPRARAVDRPKLLVLRSN
ncbi:hypothetical protein EI94DRAFT_1808014 [Lactarius quietus]|nr:hypothetical protein EI94DRAFT_1808014 [Lactarius quietus]